MNKWLRIILIFLIIIIFFWVYLSLADFTPKSNVLLERINRLELKIDSLNNKKDSIRTIIDSTHIKIVTNEKHYQERINTIVHQSSSADSSFISNYIRQHRSQRDSNYIY